MKYIRRDLWFTVVRVKGCFLRRPCTAVRHATLHSVIWFDYSALSVGNGAQIDFAFLLRIDLLHLSQN